MYSGCLKPLTARNRFPKGTTKNDVVEEANGRFDYVGWVKAGEKWIRSYINCEENFRKLIQHDYSEELSFSLEIAFGRNVQWEKTTREDLHSVRHEEGFRPGVQRSVGVWFEEYARNYGKEPTTGKCNWPSALQFTYSGSISPAREERVWTLRVRHPLVYTRSIFEHHRFEGYDTQIAVADWVENKFWWRCHEKSTCK